MLAPLLALAMIFSLQESQQNPATPVARFISNDRWNDAVAILAKAPHPVKVRLVYIGRLDPDDADAYFFSQIVSIFSTAKDQWQITWIGGMSQKDAGTTLGRGIGCSAVEADGENGKIITNAMATLGYPCSHEAAGYAPPPPNPIEPSPRRPLIPHTPVPEVVISIGR